MKTVKIIETTTISNSDDETLSNPFENGKFMIALRFGVNYAKQVWPTMTLRPRILKYLSDSPDDYEEVSIEEWNSNEYPVLSSINISEKFYWLPSSLSIRPTFRDLTLRDKYRIFITGTLTPGCNTSMQEYIEGVNYVQAYLTIFNEYLDPKNADDPIQQSYNRQYNFIMDPKQYTFPYIYIRK